MLSGDNSILQNATDAKTQTGVGQEKETIALAYNSALAKKVGNGNSSAVTDSDLNDELDRSEATASGNPIIVTFIKTGNAYEIDSNGIIKESTSRNPNASNLTNTELAAIEANNTANPTDKIEEITSSVTNTDLMDTTKIKAILTGNVPIPVDAYYLEGTVNKGVVIEYKGSQFVWVPVPEINKMVMCDKHTDGDCNIQVNSAGTGLECRIEAHKVDNAYNTEIVGRLYATDIGENFNASLTTQTYIANSGLREPAIVTDNGTGSGTSFDGNYGFYKRVLGYDSSADFLNALKLEYKTMALSVAKYGGFYIGRFETSIDGTTVASKKSSVATGEGAIMPMSSADNNQMWYGMFIKQKAFSTSGLQSSMIWGSQYDAMLKWVLGGADSSHVTATTNADHSTTVKGTGTKSTDKMNNIYDLEGNLYEWTLEARDVSVRVHRGGRYNISNSPSYRSNIRPNDNANVYGSRLSLYIK